MHRHLTNDDALMQLHALTNRPPTQPPLWVPNDQGDTHMLHPQQPGVSSMIDVPPLSKKRETVGITLLQRGTHDQRKIPEQSKVDCAVTLVVAAAM